MELDLEKAQMRMEISIWMMIDNDLFFDFNVNLSKINRQELIFLRYLYNFILLFQNLFY